MKTLTVKILVCAVICLTLGTLSGFSTINAISNWYQFLIKPSFNPPNWIFGPVWTLLYLMMGISVGIIWTSTNNGRKRALQLFAVQFVLNLCWSFLFFNLHALSMAYMEILSMMFLGMSFGLRVMVGMNPMKVYVSLQIYLAMCILLVHLKVLQLSLAM